MKLENGNRLFAVWNENCTRAGQVNQAAQFEMLDGEWYAVNDNGDVDGDVHVWHGTERELLELCLSVFESVEKNSGGVYRWKCAAAIVSEILLCGLGEVKAETKAALWRYEFEATCMSEIPSFDEGEISSFGVGDMSEIPSFDEGDLSALPPINMEELSKVCFGLTPGNQRTQSPQIERPQPNQGEGTAARPWLVMVQYDSPYGEAGKVLSRHGRHELAEAKIRRNYLGNFCRIVHADSLV